MHPRTSAEIIATHFTASIRRAIAQDLPPFELIACVEELASCHEPGLARELYQVWIHHNPADPILHAIQFNYGTMLNAAGDLARAQHAFAEAVRLRPDFMPAHVNLGSIYEALGDRARAVVQWLQIVDQLAQVSGETVGHKTLALKQIGRVLENAQDQINAEAMLQKSLDLDPHQRDTAQHWIALRQGQCKWPVIAPWGAVRRDTLMRAISPLSLAACADRPMFQLANAWHYFSQDVAPKAIGPEAVPHTVGAWPTPEPGPEPGAAPGRPARLRVGYLSSDLREHAVGFLSVELFELHDRARFEIFAYYCGPDLHDSIRARITQAADHWVDIARLTDTQVAARIVDDGIDLLIDLNGHTKDARTRAIALRPAPVIVNWLGYPGTMGSPHHHYIIADAFIIPPASDHYYSETVRRLPCYQPNDRQRVVADHTPPRSELGLPEDALVYCCFNGPQKITRPVFQRWMTILRQVPDAVLWLLCGNEATGERLRACAREEGIDPQRLVFAGRRPTPDHLARYRAADLFLDTFPYGAHTTASDALWMGVPLLTLAGQGFAARVSGSLAHAAGLGELVCDSPEAYVALAVALGQDRPRLQALRARLQAGRDCCTLFDTPSLVVHLEALYDGMWDDHARGMLPVPDLANLDVYHAIGCEEEPERVEIIPAADLDTSFRNALAYRHAVSPLPPDRRLWPGATAGSSSAGSSSAGSPPAGSPMDTDGQFRP